MSFRRAGSVSNALSLQISSRYYPEARRGDVDMYVKFSPIYQCDNKPIPNEPLFDFVSLSVE